MFNEAEAAEVVVDLSDERAKRFGSALGDSMQVRKVTQRALAEALGTSQPAVSAWIAGGAEPEPDTVFAAEEYLKLAPGSLSRHLGYLPPAAVKNVLGVEAAILDDSTLSTDAKNALLGAYRAVTGGTGTKRGRPRKSS